MKKVIRYLTLYVFASGIVLSSDVTNQFSASYYNYGGNYNYAYYDVSWYYSIIGDINKGSIPVSYTHLTLPTNREV